MACSLFLLCSFRCFLGWLHASSPQLLPDLSLELLHCHLGLENTPYTLLPRLLEHLNLGLDLFLPPLPLNIDKIHLPLRIAQLLLQHPELRLELVVPDQPGILAVPIEKLEVLPARGEVGVADVGVVEDLAHAGGVGVGGGRLLGLVTRESEGLEGCL